MTSATTMQQFNLIGARLLRETGMVPCSLLAYRDGLNAIALMVDEAIDAVDEAISREGA